MNAQDLSARKYPRVTIHEPTQYALLDFGDLPRQGPSVSLRDDLIQLTADHPLHEDDLIIMKISFDEELPDMKLAGAIIDHNDDGYGTYRATIRPVWALSGDQKLNLKNLRSLPSNNISYEVIVGGNMMHCGMSVNFSGGGMRMQGQLALEVGQIIILKTNLPGLKATIAAMATVVWRREIEAERLFEHGLEFAWTLRL